MIQAERPQSESDQLSNGDRSLVALIRKGDEQAAGQLYERYAKRLFGLVRSQIGDYLGTRVDPEDIVQSVFKSMFRGINAGNYDAPDGSTLWHLMAVIAVHKVRRKATRQAAARREDRHHFVLESRPDSEFADRQSPAEIECAIREAIEVLRTSEREIVMLRIQGYTIEEISERTQRSRRTVERGLQRARERLADLLLAEK